MLCLSKMTLMWQKLDKLNLNNPHDSNLSRSDISEAPFSAKSEDGITSTGNENLRIQPSPTELEKSEIDFFNSAKDIDASARNFFNFAPERLLALNNSWTTNVIQTQEARIEALQDQLKDLKSKFQFEFSNILFSYPLVILFSDPSIFLRQDLTKIIPSSQPRKLDMKKAVMTSFLKNTWTPSSKVFRSNAPTQ